DVRPLPGFSHEEYPYPHKLGICVQPIYYHADWTAFIQFFEYWIAAGATKFYIYLHSCTRQVKRILDFYSVLLGDGMELIEWSDLPVAQKNRGNFFDDPNTRLFRAGAYAAINDCTLRARWRVKYLALMDIDEIMKTTNGTQLVHRLDQLADLSPFSATFSLQWRYAMFENNQRLKRIRFPKQISFDSLGQLGLVPSESVQYDYARLRKIIQRPERVLITDIHNTISNENIPIPSE
ncbi:hypothetical protein PFISCL1PPCAC_14525, partial [Pristionchus fissidentatus]